MNLPRIKASLKTGTEHLTFNNKQLKFTLLDFWKWSISDLLSNATRGVLSEFIVATAVKADIKKPREEWARYDVLSKDGIKIEVKSAAYLQSWFQKRYSSIQFSIKPARYWDPDTNKISNEKERYADVYVFCLLKEKDKTKVDPLNMDQWEFYVLSVDQINSYRRSQTSITLNSLQKLTKPVDYGNLYNEIKNRVSN